VTSLEFRDRLARRARRAKAPLTIAMLDPLEAYYRLLTHWNARINLTALPLEAPTDETFDRLLVEPLAAAPYVTRGLTGVRHPSDPWSWLDLGSGGGSPAIPLLIAKPQLRLTMVESKTRKATFLREALRAVGLADAGTVLSERFEDVTRAVSYEHAADLITVRAVKTDAELFQVVDRLLKTEGRLFLFRPAHVRPNPPRFDLISTVKLTDAPPAFLSSYKRAFHVEQSG
jgi:16S rRNA (guanine527-N7)-methyltransferase